MPSIPNSPSPSVQQPSRPMPVSPFDRSPSAASPQSPAIPTDSLNATPLAQGKINANLKLMHDGQSQYSPFFRPEGGAPVEPTPAQPTPQQPQQPGKIVFTLPKDIPPGPAAAGVEQAVLQQAQSVQNPQQAMQLMESHIEAAKGSREQSNRITWGARYYAAQAAESAEQALSQWGQMTAPQKEVYLSKIQEYRDQAIGLLNEAKSHSIQTYNSALKANLLYNHFFTSTGPMTEALPAENRELVKAALDDGWSRWNGTFPKQWQGQMVQAQGAYQLIESTTEEVNQHLHRMNSVLSQLQ